MEVEVLGQKRGGRVAVGLPVDPKMIESKSGARLDGRTTLANSTGGHTISASEGPPR